MGFRINTNVGAMNAHMNAVNNNKGLDNSLSALSSGLRINKSADDASGLAIANKLSAQQEGLGQAIRNSNDGIALLQTADGAMDEMGEIAKRIRTLAVQAANDTQDTASRGYITKEIAELTTQFNQIVSSTSFNDKKLLDGSNSSINIQIGHTNGDSKNVGIAGVGTIQAGVNVQASAVAVTAASNNGVAKAAVASVASVVGFQVDTVTNAQNTIATMDELIKNIDGARADIGANQNSLESNVRNISVTQVNVAAAESNIRDVDFAQESANLQKHNILAQSGTYAMSQANSAQQNVMTLLR